MLFIPSKSWGVLRVAHRPNLPATLPTPPRSLTVLITSTARHSGGAFCFNLLTGAFLGKKYPHGKSRGFQSQKPQRFTAGRGYRRSGGRLARPLVLFSGCCRVSGQGHGIAAHGGPFIRAGLRISRPSGLSAPSRLDACPQGTRLMLYTMRGG